jgi:Kef-type K+ transport system membrane component KefB
VVEIVLGIIIGPQVLGWAHLDEVLKTLAEFGLVFLIFLAGFEIDPNRVKGRPVKLAVTCWLISLAAGTGVAWVLCSSGVTLSIRFIAIALTTTAVGTLLPILGDAGILPTKLGTNILAGGAMGEIGPIIAISVALATDNPARTTLVLLGFAAVAAAAVWLATRPAKPRTVQLISRTLHSSGQLGVRICVLLMVLLVWIAGRFGLDILLGAFAAGMVARLFLVAHSEAEQETDAQRGQRQEVTHRLEALGFGFFIPIFFVVSGIKFNIQALEHWGAAAKVPMFLALFLLVRGLPAVLYRKDLPRVDVVAMGLLQSAALPLLVVITTLGVDSGQMRSDNAAAMVGAGLLSVVILPIAALGLRSRAATATAAPEPATLA